MKLAHIFSIALLASCQAVPHSFEVLSGSNCRAIDASSGQIPPATKDVTIHTHFKNRTSYLSLLTAVAESSGVQLVLYGGVKSKLSQGINFERDFTIPADEAWIIMENVLMQGGFHLSALHLGEAKVVTAYSIAKDGLGSSIDPVSVRGTIKVNKEELGYLASHPAFIFSLTLELPNTDIPGLVTELRSLGYHSRELRCLPLGEGVLVLEGLGGVLEKVARRLVDADEHNGRRIEAERKEHEVKQPVDSKGATAG